VNKLSGMIWVGRMEHMGGEKRGILRFDGETWGKAITWKT